MSCRIVSYRIISRADPGNVIMSAGHIVCAEINSDVRGVNTVIVLHDNEQYYSLQPG